MRVAVKPEAAEFVERLSYTFDEPANAATALALRWEKLRIAVPITVDTKAVTLASIRDQLRGLPRFSWQGWNQAAGWCARNDVITDEALAWSDRSIGMQKTFPNLRTKALLLEKKGDAKGAAALRAEALPLASEADVNNLGYQLLGDGKTAEALEYFRKNTKDHPQSWNVWDSLAEGLAKSGDAKGAREIYEKALGMAPAGSEAAHQRGAREAEIAVRPRTSSRASPSRRRCRRACRAIPRARRRPSRGRRRRP